MKKIFSKKKHVRVLEAKKVQVAQQTQIENKTQSEPKGKKKTSD